MVGWQRNLMTLPTKYLYSVGVFLFLLFLPTIVRAGSTTKTQHQALLEDFIPVPINFAVLDEDCTVSVLNRTVRVNSDGIFVVPNIPASGVFARARVICQKEQQTYGGLSEFFQVQPNGTIPLGAIRLGPMPPTVQSLEATATPDTLDASGSTSQLTVTATLSDGSTRDVSSASEGTTYTGSNPAIATVSPDGLVTAAGQSGTVIVSITNEGVFTAKSISVGGANDQDGDGLPDDFEAANPCLNPNSPETNPNPDNDGLTNLQEFNIGSAPCIADTDGDGLNDGQEVTQGTNPANPDSDGDGLSDGNEVVRSCNPLNRDGDNDGLPDGIEVAIVNNCTGANSATDNDGDGLSNLDEVTLSTDPTDPDTDNDGLEDGAEVLAGGDPLVPERIPPVVAIVSPADGATLIEGQTIIVQVDATDNAIVERVDIMVNDAPFTSDSIAPYELTFTVPAGVNTLTFSARARDVAGNVSTLADTATLVSPNFGTTVQGTVVDRDTNPVSGADVVVNLTGLNAEFFDFAAPLASLPDLTGLTPNATAILSTVNIRNPAQLFGLDPFGAGLTPHYAARLTGSIRATTAGLYTFTLGANEGVKLTVNGIVVIDQPSGTGAFQEHSGTINLASGPAPIELLFYQSAGASELQLSYIQPGGSQEVVPQSAFVLPQQPFTALTNTSGEFSIPTVPANLGDLQVSATFTTPDARQLSGVSSPTPSANGGATDVGQIVVDDVIFEPNIGSRIERGCDDCFVQRTLPFSIAFFGQTYTTIFVGSNGYLTFNGGDSDFTESVGEFPRFPRISAFWDDIISGGTSRTDDGVFVNDQLPGKFVVTWFHNQEYCCFGDNTFQITLFADGRIQFVYNGLTTQDAIVGITPGGSAPLSTVDYSATPSFSTTEPATILEQFFGSANNPFDLDGWGISFTPNASGGYDVRTTQPLSAGGMGSLEGTVTEATGAPVANAEVRVTSSRDLSYTRTVRTNARGLFTLARVPAGGVSIVVSRNGTVVTQGGLIIEKPEDRASVRLIAETNLGSVREKPDPSNSR